MADASDYANVEVYEDDDDQPIYVNTSSECNTSTNEDPFDNDDDSNDSYDVLKDFGSIGKQYADSLLQSIQELDNGEA